jgi:hypothetical protein
LNKSVIHTEAKYVFSACKCISKKIGEEITEKGIELMIPDGSKTTFPVIINQTYH